MVSFSTKGTHTAILFLVMVLGLVAATLVTGQLYTEIVFAIAILMTTYDIIRAVTAKPALPQPLGIGIGRVRLIMHAAVVLLFLLYWIFYGFSFVLMVLALYSVVLYAFVRLVMEMRIR